MAGSPAPRQAHFAPLALRRSLRSVRDCFDLFGELDGLVPSTVAIRLVNVGALRRRPPGKLVGSCLPLRNPEKRAIALVLTMGGGGVG